MWDWIQREAVYLWYYLDIQIRQIAPYWALGIVLGSFVSVFGEKYIHGAFAKIGQRKMGWLGVIPASILGIASPLCMYGTIPIAASFSEQGGEGRLPGRLHDVQHFAEPAADLLQRRAGPDCADHPLRQLLSVRLCCGVADSLFLQRKGKKLL